MTPEEIIDIFQHTTLVTISLMSVIIIPGLIAGFIISVLQAATQITEQSLSFIPKLFITFCVLTLSSPWVIKTILDFYEYIIQQVLLVSS